MANWKEKEVAFFSLDSFPFNRHILYLWLHGFTVTQSTLIVLESFGGYLDECLSHGSSPVVTEGGISASTQPPMTKSISTSILPSSGHSFTETGRNFSRGRGGGLAVPFSSPPSESPSEIISPAIKQTTAHSVKSSPNVPFSWEKHHPTINKFLECFIKQQFYTFEFLEPFLVNPFMFLQETIIQMKLSDRIFIIQSYHEIQVGFLRELWKLRKKAFTLSLRRILTIASSCGIPVISLHRQLENLKRVYKWISTPSSSATFVSILAEKSNTGVISQSEEIRSFSFAHIIGYSLYRRYFQICWIFQHKISCATKRLLHLQWTHIEALVELLLIKLNFETLDIPMHVIRYSKELQDLYKKVKPFEDLKQNFLTAIRSADSNGTAQRFSRYVDNQRTFSLLKTLLDFIFCFSSPKKFSKVFLFLLDISERRAGTGLFFEGILSAFQVSLSKPSLQVFAATCCDIAKSFGKKLETLCVAPNEGIPSEETGDALLPLVST
ncbi:hypothetical protein IE077_000532 [Cardiosporidium cionae]|uniref:Uncharacterized protein n=1 Tax=Cardiosporidium cionae TaxID=476202 RepID=A0ABQ7J8E7_9APIC|nr:hypothetical protein IE077_000532 [Cardiosporidium cionae]|eukprot:KAF8820265.1 hypothetical protein IE077_000532 [Cardiosporidium cionae]